MTEAINYIPNRVRNAAVGGHVCGSVDIIDDDLGLEQNAINKEVAGVVPYDQANPNGMGRVVLKKNDNFKTVVEAQTDGNTIFVIKYDFTLTGNVTIPSNCVLEFDGGSISNGTIVGNHTKIVSPTVAFSNITFSGTYDIDCFRLSWFHKEGEVCNDGLDSIINLNKNVFIDLELVYLERPVVVTATEGSIYGLGARITKIKPTPNFVAGGTDNLKAFFIFSRMVSSTYISGIEFSGLANNVFTVDFGLFFYSYPKNVVRCNFFYFSKVAVVIGGSEHNVIRDNIMEHCGCAIYTANNGINTSNIIEYANFDVTLNPEQNSTIADIEISGNYIGLCNYCMILRCLVINATISKNCIAYSSCYGMVIESLNNAIVEKNYFEGLGDSIRWIYNGLTLSDYQAQSSNTQTISNLLESHRDIYGLTMTGWGVPRDSNNPNTYKVRPAIWVFGDMFTLRDNDFSCNHIRTSQNDTAINYSDSAIGLDSVLLINVNHCNYENNRLDDGNGNRYKYAILTNGFRMIYTMAGPSQDNEIYFNDYLYKEDYVKQLDGNIKLSNTNNKKDCNITLGKRCAYHRLNPYNETFDKNLHNLGTSHKTINNICFTKLGVSPDTYQGCMWVIPRELITKSLYLELFYYNNSNSDINDIPTCIASFSNVGNLKSNIKNIYVNLPSNKIIPVRFQLSVHEETDEQDTWNYIAVYSEVGSSTNIRDVYISDLFIRNIGDSIDYDLSSSITDKLGRLICGTTNERPVGVEVGFKYFDTTLNKPIFAKSVDASTEEVTWVDATGTQV